ncbi:MAG: hypothetical protein ACPGES_07115 [Coraliomargarita sp.]
MSKPIEFIEADQNSIEKITRYWFKVGDEVYGISDQYGERILLDSEGCRTDYNSADRCLRGVLSLAVDNLNKTHLFK